MSDTQNLKAKTNIIVYLATGSLQGTSIIGELEDQNLEYEVRCYFSNFLPGQRTCNKVLKAF